MRQLDRQTIEQVPVIDVARVAISVSLIVIIGDLLNCFVVPYLNRILPFTFYLFMSGKFDRATFLLGMWAVQATIGAITIALLTLLAGLIKDRIYGVPFLVYLTDTKSRIRLNVWEETVIVIAITGFEYVPIAKLMMVTSTIMFVIAFALILDILFRILRVLVFQEHVEENVKTMILASVLQAVEQENRSEPTDEISE